MTIDQLKDMTLTEILELRGSVALITDKYAKELTTYATTSGDMTFTKLDPRSMDTANKRIKTVNLLDKIDRIIENKVLALADELAC